MESRKGQLEEIMYLLGNNITVNKNTGASNINLTIEPESNGYIHGLRIHISDYSDNNNLKLTIKSGVSSVYDILILSQNMSNVTDFMWVPDSPIYFEPSSRSYSPSP